jgi:hypothetical protein
MEPKKIHSSRTHKKVMGESGFATFLLLAILPILVSGFLALLFSQYLSKNWMESLHICRTHLLGAQDKAAKNLTDLIRLNKTVKLLRVSMIQAKIELAAAIAAKNPGLVAIAKRKILMIKRQQQAVFVQQNLLITNANSYVSYGAFQVVRLLSQQNAVNLSRLPDFFDYRIHRIQPSIRPLAIRPVGSEKPPIYELKNQFSEQQAVSVSWISTFRTQQKGSQSWFSNQHDKSDACSATIEAKQDQFTAILRRANPP